MLTTHTYFIHLSLELDGEVIDERFVEPDELVFIGHEQRSNLLCWGRLPRRLQLFKYERGIPILLISPQWLTQKTNQLSIAPKAHPSERVIPTPLGPGQRFTLDLDGALLHVERLELDRTVREPHVPAHIARAGSKAARCIAAASMLACGLLWSLSSVLWARADPQLKVQVAMQQRSSEASKVEVAPSVAHAPAISRRVGGMTPTMSYRQDDTLSWQAREVQRLLQRRSTRYRECFDASTSKETSVLFTLGVSPSEHSSHVTQQDVSSDAEISAQLVECLGKELHKVQLPHYERAFSVRFHMLFEP